MEPFFEGSEGGLGGNHHFANWAHDSRCEQTQRVQHDDDESMIISDDRPDGCSTSGEKGKFAEVRGSICYFAQEAAERPRTVHNAGDLRPD